MKIEMEGDNEDEPTPMPPPPTRRTIGYILYIYIDYSSSGRGISILAVRVLTVNR
jgi:hypothetical protein